MENQTQDRSAATINEQKAAPTRFRDSVGGLRLKLEAEQAHNKELREAFEANRASAQEMLTAIDKKFEDACALLGKEQAESSMLRGEVAQLKKELESVKQSKKWADDAREKADKELQQAHVLLDGLPGIIGQTVKTNRNGYEQDAEVPIATRIASYLTTLLTHRTQQ